MAKKSTLEIDGIKVTYSDPVIVPYNQGVLENVDDIMHFYYALEVKKGNKILFKTRTGDHSIADKMPFIIEDILEAPTALIESAEDEGFSYTQHFARTTIGSPHFVDYYAQIEKIILERVGYDQTVTDEHYNLRFGHSPKRQSGLDDAHNVSTDIVFHELSRDDLLDFKRTIEEFIKIAIEDYHETN